MHELQLRLSFIFFLLNKIKEKLDYRRLLMISATYVFHLPFVPELKRKLFGNATTTPHRRLFTLIFEFRRSGKTFYAFKFKFEIMKKKKIPNYINSYINNHLYHYF